MITASKDRSNGFSFRGTTYHIDSSAKDQKTRSQSTLDFSFSCCDLSIVIEPVPVSKAAASLSAVTTRKRIREERRTHFRTICNPNRYLKLILRSANKICDRTIHQVSVQSLIKRVNFLILCVENLKEYRTVATSVRIRISEIGRITEKKGKNNIECVRIKVREIIGGGQCPDRSCIERRGARHRYVAEARSLICDPVKNGGIWMRLNDR